MGTDIHFLVQVQTTTGWKNVWQMVSREEYVRKYPWSAERGLSDPVCCPFYSTRNYDVFCMLANVRSSGYLPLVVQRGLPADLVQVEDGYGTQGLVDSDFPEGCRDEWGEREEYHLGDHSYSWVTLTELIEYFEAFPEYQEDAGDFYDSVIPHLIEVATQRGLRYDQVRCVFGFDS